MSLFQEFRGIAPRIHSQSNRTATVGGYIVIHQTEALVAIDVNSGRATRERDIEETALKTNCEAAEEIAYQLKLRDLAGLIVIDFIDMEENRNNITVERRFKDSLRSDRARIQIGRISPFGLLEMSRQRLRPSLIEITGDPCPHCGGTGFMQSTDWTALQVLRAMEETANRERATSIELNVSAEVALYILNQKRQALSEIEERNGLSVTVSTNGEIRVVSGRSKCCSVLKARATNAAKKPAKKKAAKKAVAAVVAGGAGNRVRKTTKLTRPRRPTQQKVGKTKTMKSAGKMESEPVADGVADGVADADAIVMRTNKPKLRKPAPKMKMR